MKWKDLTLSSKCVLERCWGLTHDKPMSFSVEIGKVLSGNEVTYQTLVEIMEYRKHFPYFNIKVENNLITVNGNCVYGSWTKSKKTEKEAK